MIGPVLMVLIAACCLLRLLTGVRRPVEGRLASLGHGAMAVAMAGRYEPRLALPVASGVWTVVFGVLAGGFLVAFARSSGSGPDGGAAVRHRDGGLACLAMVFILLPPGGDGGTATGVLPVALVVALVVGAAGAAGVLRAADRERREDGRAAGAWVLITGPVMPAACHVVMVGALTPMILAG